MTFTLQELRCGGEVVDVALGPLGFGFDAAALGERRLLPFGPIERLLVRHRAGPERTGSSVSRKNLSSAADQSAILMSLRRCARTSAWSRNITVIRLSVSISFSSR